MFTFFPTKKLMGNQILNKKCIFSHLNLPTLSMAGLGLFWQS
jgi:hypothetical protein